MKHNEKLEKNIFRSRLAKRIFLAFISCALIPILVIFIITFTQVTRHFQDVAQNNLKRSTKAHGLAIYEKLLLLESELKNTALYIRQGYEHDRIPHDLMQDPSDISRFTSKYIATADHRTIPLCNNCPNPPPVPESTRTALLSGKTAILNPPSADKHSRVFMIVTLDQSQTQAELLVGEVNISYLWGIGSNHNLPVNTDICVVDENNRVLIQSFPPSKNLQNLSPTSTEKIWINDGDRYLTSEWSVFLKSRFHAGNWKIILAQEKTAIQAPLNQFKQLFPLVVLLSIWLILLFSIASIRKNLIPLQLLKKKTLQVAQGNFKSEVVVDSHDEFEELAVSLNTMSAKLSKQFDTLKVIEDISNTAFSYQGSSSIIHSLLSSLRENLLDLSLFLIDRRGNVQAYLIDKTRLEITPYPKSFKLTEDELRLFSSERQNLVFNREKGLPEFLMPIGKDGLSDFALTPFFTAGKLAGLLVQSVPTGCPPASEDSGLRQRLADQLSIALSNAKLVEDLNSLSRGTMRALARAVDTKSPWTAGHSERVAKLGVQIGKEMGLGKDDLEKLEQAGLLHDIGKIGVSTSILDKPGKLSSEEFNSISQHPSLGVRILEPINTFGEIIPAILHHHERFDGSGYPHGLKSVQIPLEARILAVADVYDALSSDRPYRSGWDDSRILDLFEKETGRHFDPEVVSALLKLKTEEKKLLQPPRHPAAKVM